MVRWLILKLFKLWWAMTRRERNAPSIHRPNLVYGPKGPEIKLSQHNRKYPVDEDQINLDCSTLLVQLTMCKYEPVQIMHLMAKLYGAMMAAAPDHVGITITGELITPEMIEKEFFQECTEQRNHFFKLKKNMFGGIEEVIGKGTIH